MIIIGEIFALDEIILECLCKRWIDIETGKWERETGRGGNLCLFTTKIGRAGSREGREGGGECETGPLQ